MLGAGHCCLSCCCHKTRRCQSTPLIPPATAGHCCCCHSHQRVVEWSASRCSQNFFWKPGAGEGAV